jgi:hypothetical protein
MAAEPLVDFILASFEPGAGKAANRAAAQVAKPRAKRKGKQRR